MVAEMIHSAVDPHMEALVVGILIMVVVVVDMLQIVATMVCLEVSIHLVDHLHPLEDLP